jgi:hypothetical protein
MIQLVLAHVDLARVRFAHSPVRELAASLLVLQDPDRQTMHGGWVSAARRQLGGLPPELLIALVPTGRYLPSFLLPPPSGTTRGTGGGAGRGGGHAPGGRPVRAGPGP